MSKYSRYIDRERYFAELAQTSEEFILPYIRHFHELSSNDKVLEVGCGEGGLLCPFATRGCEVTGVDISDSKIENASLFYKKRHLKGMFFTENILDDNTALAGKTFDIIIVHDVIEHIEPGSKKLFVDMLGRYLAPDGLIYIGFPAWYMPFGGHQQICKKPIGKNLPFTHLLPLKAYRSFLKKCGEDEVVIEELTSIYRSRMTIEKFEALSIDSGFETIDRKLWLINPHYKAKFNLFPIKLPFFLSGIPHIRNVFSSSCFYILKRKENE